MENSIFVLILWLLPKPQSGTLAAGGLEHELYHSGSISISPGQPRALDPSPHVPSTLSHPTQLLVSWAASAHPSSLWLRSFANLGCSHKAGGGCHLFTGLKMHCGDPERKGELWEAAAPHSGFVIIHLLVSTECASGFLLCSSLLHVPAAWINGGQQIKPAPGGAGDSRMSVSPSELTRAPAGN